MSKSRVLFSKEGKAKYVSHLDLMRTMQRVFMRAGMGIKHSEGFNPHPRITFALPLSVGAESVCELMDFELVNNMSTYEITAAMNASMPEGIKILSAYEPETKFKDIAWIHVAGRLEYDNGTSNELIDSLIDFFGAESIIIEKKSKNKIADFDIAPCIKSIRFCQDSKIVLMDSVIMAQNPGLNPELLVNALRQRKEMLVPDFYEFKRLELFDKDMKIFK